MPTLVRLTEANLTGPTDPAEYAAQLQELLAELGTTVGSAESAAIEILDQARQEIQTIIGSLALDSPTRGLLERARSGIDQATANLADDMGKTIADFQTQGFAQGVDLAIKPLGAEKGLEVVSNAVTQQQLAVLTGFSADLIQGIAGDTRKRINAEIASIIVGAKSPHSAAVAIGKNLHDLNHFSTIAHRARAIVVTEVGRAHALGTQAAQNQLQATFNDAGTGDQVRKRWLNAHLPGARATHLQAEATYSPDGATGPIASDQLYQVGGFKALYPRDPSLPASESVNCHCVSVTVIDEGSAQGAAAGPNTAKAQTAYTAAHADAAGAAEKATAKGPALTKSGAQFLGSPYSKAGLQPLKPLANGTNGYGGEFLATKLGYTKTNNPLVWDADLKAFKHPKAPAGKQLPDFAGLAPLEQKALMDAAELSAVAQGKIYKHLGVEKPKAKPYAVKKPKPDTAPVTPPPAPAAPTPPPSPAPPPVATPAASTATRATTASGRSTSYAASGSNPLTRAARRAKEVREGRHALSPLWDPATRSTKPSLKRKPYTDRFKEMIDEVRARWLTTFGKQLPVNPTAAGHIEARAMKDRSMVRIGAIVDDAHPRGRLEEFLNSAFPARFDPGSPRTPGQQISSRITANWAATSGDSHPGALAFQRAVADQFDLPWPPTGYSRVAAETITQAEDLYNKWADILDTYVLGLYDETQRELERLFPGQDHIDLVRGMNIAGRSSMQSARLEEIMLNPASSFAINPTTSKRFGTTLIYCRVPKERILGNALTGLGCLNEYEFVVLGARAGEQLTTIGKNA